MKPLNTRPALLADASGTLGGPITRARVQAARRGPGLLARVWYRYQAGWLAWRLRRVEAELLHLRARRAQDAAEGKAPVSREGLAAYEGCRMERALLRARIDWCRASS